VVRAGDSESPGVSEGGCVMNRKRIDYSFIEEGQGKECIVPPAFVNEIRNSWSKDTAYPKCADQWNKCNPSLGQCAVTALVVQDYLGGIIKFNRYNNHFFNEIRGKVVDLAFDQFLRQGVEIDFSDATEVTRDWILHGEGSKQSRTWERYIRLTISVKIQKEKK